MTNVTLIADIIQNHRHEIRLERRYRAMKNDCAILSGCYLGQWNEEMILLASISKAAFTFMSSRTDTSICSIPN